MNLKNEQQQNCENLLGNLKVLASWRIPVKDKLGRAMLGSGAESRQREQRNESLKKVQLCSFSSPNLHPLTHTQEGKIIGYTITSRIKGHQSPQSNSRVEERPCWDGVLIKRIDHQMDIFGGALETGRGHYSACHTTIFKSFSFQY